MNAEFFYKIFHTLTWLQARCLWCYTFVCYYHPCNFILLTELYRWCFFCHLLMYKEQCHSYKKWLFILVKFMISYIKILRNSCSCVFLNSTLLFCVMWIITCFLHVSSIACSYQLYVEMKFTLRFCRHAILRACEGR